MKKMLLPIFALALGIGFSAFTKAKQMSSDLVWFQVDPSTGQALNSSSGGVEGDTSPFDCPGGTNKCATALSISQNEVVDNHDGTYGIASGVDITSSAYYDDREFQQ